MKRETQAFLAKVRDAENPSLADEERVFGSLCTSLALGMASSAIAQPKSSSLWLTKTAANIGGLGSKLSVLAAVIAPALGPGDTCRSLPEPTTPSVALVDRSEPRVGLGEHSSRVSDVGLESSASTSLGPPAPGSHSVGSKPMQSPRIATARGSTGEPLVSTLRPELELLRDVQAALKRGDGQAALRQLDSHATTDRRLLAERQAARILALCMVGRVDEGRRAAAAFSQLHPGSLHQEAIGRACANSQRIHER